MKKLILLFSLIAILWPSNVLAHWDDDTYVEWQEVSDWDSLLELECFLALDDTNEKTILLIERIKVGRVTFERGDCDDYAYKLRDRAKEANKRLETEVIEDRSTYWRVFRQPCSSDEFPHMLNKARIGNWIYLVEPQDDSVEKYLPVD